MKHKNIQKILFIFFSGILLAGIYRTASSGPEAVSAFRDTEKFYASGIPVGIYLKTEGLLVLGNDRIDTEHGQVDSPCLNRIQSGDYLLKYNGIPLNSKKQLQELLRENRGETVVFTIVRGEETLETKITPVYTPSSEGGQLGLWIRNDTQGIGTITFVKEDGTFMALGHNITDIDLGVPFCTQGGSVYATNISNIQKGKKGIPGALIGSIDYRKEFCIGVVHKNIMSGIQGTLHGNPANYWTTDAMPIAKNEEITVGNAVVRTSISGIAKNYTVTIERIRSRKKQVEKSCILRITDPELLQMTGGIIQGLSGSPLLQNGKIIGAVTHVFVNDPSRGYGIFIENMLEE